MAVCEKESVIERTRRMSVKQIKTQEEARKGDAGHTAEVLWLYEKQRKQIKNTKRKKKERIKERIRCHISEF